MLFEEFLQELSNLRVKVAHIFHCIENPMYLKIGSIFNSLYLEHFKRYPHSVKSNDSFLGGKFDCEKRTSYSLP